jgi:hypothetical protein
MTRIVASTLPVVPAHDQYQTIRLKRHYEEHEARSDDPYKKMFEEVKARLKRQGLWKCVIGNADCAGEMTLHHDEVEFAYANSVDLPDLNLLLGLHLTDEEFQEFIDEPGNLECLCANHHLPSGNVPIHLIPAADWTIVRVHKSTTAPVVVEHGRASARGARLAHPCPL